MRKPSIRTFAAAVFAALALWPVEASVPEAAPPSAGESLPAIKSHRYQMAGRIRPLLFWVGRDDVGLARIVWRGEGGGARGFDFLVGTDAAKAPRHINRWGFIAEHVAGASGSVLAVMSKSDESSLGEAQAVDGGTAGREYKAIHSSVDRGVLSWRVAAIRTPTALTITELAPLLDRARVETAAADARSRPVGANQRPGFLVAVAELVDRAVAARTANSPTNRLEDANVPYVFGQQSYTLRFASVAPATLPRPDGAGTVAGCVSVLEIRNLSTGQRTTFDMSFGTDGELAGVPVTIAWQPKWWLKVELALGTLTRTIHQGRNSSPFGLRLRPAIPAFAQG